MPPYTRSAFPNAIIEGSGFGYYSLGGYETYGMLVSMPSEIAGINKKVLTLIAYINGWEMQFTYGTTDLSFETEMPEVQAMINSIRINA